MQPKFLYSKFNLHHKLDIINMQLVLQFLKLIANCSQNQLRHYYEKAQKIINSSNCGFNEVYGVNSSNKMVIRFIQIFVTRQRLFFLCLDLSNTILLST